MHRADESGAERAGGERQQQPPPPPQPQPPQWPPDTGRAALVRLRRFGGDDLVRDMSAILLEDVPTRLAAARRGARAGDARAVELAVHSMKSSCAQFGADAVASLCLTAERAARAGELGALPALLDEIERSFALFRRWLEREVALRTERE